LFPIPLPAVLVDIETTGGHVTGDRITEIAIIEITESGTSEWSTLINPGIHIPLSIQSLTGISNAMVASAPRFEQVAKEILLRLQDKLFIAHNVRFDYGFIRNEFARLGHQFTAPLLCTVKLSRSLYPEHKSHSLANIIARHRIAVQDRHRALADTRATLAFMQLALAEKGDEKFTAAVRKQSGKASAPPGLPSDLIDQLPNQPGVYYFWSERRELLYIGKSLDIRKRVLSHFSSDHKAAKEMAICQQTRDITWDITSGELSALIREAQQIKALQPLYNRRLRRLTSLCSIYLQEDAQGVLRPQIAEAAELTRARSRLYGLFANQKKARDALKEIGSVQGLCNYVTGLEAPNKRPCMAYQLKRCKGLCAGEQSAVAHNVQLMAGLESLALRTWPYPGPIALIETHPVSGDETHFIIHNWCLLGIAQEPDDYVTILRGEHLNENTTPQLDKDIYRYLAKAIVKAGSGYCVRQLKI